MKDQVEKQARKNFNDFIKAGNKLPYNDLRKLNSSWKKDYANEVFKETQEINTKNDIILENEVYFA